MLTKEEIAKIIGTAILFDEQQRFDEWRGDEARRWVCQVAEAIWSAQQSVKSDECYVCDKKDELQTYTLCEHHASVL